MLNDRCLDAPIFTVEHCHYTEKLRQALAVVLDRVHRLSQRADLPDDGRAELRRAMFGISAHGIRAVREAIGADDQSR